MPRLDTDTAVRRAIATAVIPPGRRDVLLFDGGYKRAIAGFGLRVFKSGHASFVLKYQVGKGRGARTRRMSLGEVAQNNLDKQLDRLRSMADEIKDHGRVLGKDIIAEHQAVVVAARAAKDAPTLRKLAPLYLRDRARGWNDNGKQLKQLKPKTLIEVTRYLAGTERTPAVWEPVADLPLSSITMRQLQDVVEATAKAKGAVTADRSRVALSGFFAWAIELRHTDRNPTNDLTAYSLGKARERTLSEQELVQVWRGCLDDDHGRIVKLLMLTGCRRGEIGDLHRQEIDLQRRRIELPPHRCKNGREHVIPLSAPALAVLKSIPVTHRGLVFGQGSGGYSGWSKSKGELDARINAARAERGKEPMAPWVLHDIRRTVVTLLLESRERVNARGKRESFSFAQPHIVEAVVGHISGHRGGIAGVYNKAEYFGEKREALEKWAAHLTALIEKRPERRKRGAAARVTA